MKIAHLFLLAHFLFAYVHCQTSSPAAQSQVLDTLWSFYDVTGGQNWLNTTGWIRNSTSYCNFYGVTCDGDFFGLDLKSNNLEGEIPESISKIGGVLTRFTVSFNNLKGRLPDSFFDLNNLSVLEMESNTLSGNVSLLQNMRNLTILNLEGNQFSGKFPALFLPKLVDLKIGNNLFSGPFPTNNISQVLSEVWLRNNQFEGPFPASVMGKSIYGLHISGCLFEGEIPDIFENHPTCLYMYAANNRFTGRVPKSAFTNMYTLDLRSNQLNGTLPESAGRVSSLWLSGNKMTGHLPDTFIRTLSGFYLQDNQFTGTIPPFGPSAYLVDLSNNLLEGPIPRDICNCEYINTLRLGSNRLNGTIPECLSTTSLNQIYLDNNNLEGEIPGGFFNSSSLSVLSFSHNKLSGVGAYGSLGKSLSTVDISFNRLSGPLPGLFKEPGIVSLKLNNNQFTWPTPNGLYFVNGQRLVEIDVSHNNIRGNLFFSGALDSALQLEIFRANDNFFTGSFPTLYKQVKIKVFDISNNLMTGSIPIELYYAPFTHLNIENNRFGGTLPPTVSQITSLQEVSIGGNRFTGGLDYLLQLPNLLLLNASSNSMGGILPEIRAASLQTLDLSRNKLQGNLTQSLRKLKLLKTLSLSNNRFGGSFSTESDPLILDLGNNQFGGDLEWLGQLASLQFLNISNNLFNGGIPDVRGQKKLEVFDLSNNDLNGTLIGFGGLTELKVVNLSHNKLIGSAPTVKDSLKLRSLDCSFNGFRDASLFSLPPTANCSLLSNPLLCPISGQVIRQCSASCSIESNSTSTIRIRIEGEIEKFDEDGFLQALADILAITLNRMVVIQITAGSVIVDLQINPPPQTAQTEGSSPVTLSLLQYYLENSPEVFISRGIKVLDHQSPIPIVTTSGATIGIVSGSNASEGFKWTVTIIAIIVASGVAFVIILLIIVLVVVKRRRSRPGLQLDLLDLSNVNFSAAKKSTIDFDEIKDLKIVGQGAYGIVYKARWRQTDVAVKQIRAERVTEEQLSSFIQEVAILQSLRPHPNVVLFMAVTFPPQPLSLITEFCEGGSLYSYLRDHSVSMDQKVLFIKGIARGMYHLHEEKIIHRDLAVRNILLSKGLEPKVADFGMSRETSGGSDGGTTKSEVGPLKWMSPEAIKSKEYSIYSDVWSFGVTMWEIITVRDPFEGEGTLMEVAIGIMSGKTLEIPKESRELGDLMKACFSPNPPDRPNFSKICYSLGDKEMGFPPGLPQNVSPNQYQNMEYSLRPQTHSDSSSNYSHLQ